MFLNTGQTATGWSWTALPPNLPITAPANSIYIYADIDGDGLADFLTIDPATGAVNAWLNKGILAGGGLNLQSIGQIASGANPFAITNPGYGVTFTDVDGDGKADYVVTDPVSGESYAYINGGFGSNGINWTAFGLPLTTPTGYTGWYFFADLNADRKADFLIDQNGGNVVAYLNGGQVGQYLNWELQGQVATGITPYTNNQYVRFADLDGDGRADYIVLNTVTGAITAAYLNNGGDTGTLVKP